MRLECGPGPTLPPAAFPPPARSRRRPAHFSSRLVSSSVPAVAPIVAQEVPESAASPRVEVDGRDGRVRVPVPSAARMFQLTRELGLRSHGETLAWILENGEPFVCDEVTPASSGCVRAMHQLWKSEKKRKKSLLPINAGQEYIQKKKGSRKQKQTLHIAHPLKVSKGLGAKRTKRNPIQGARKEENGVKSFLKRKVLRNFYYKKEASLNAEVKVGRGRGRGLSEVSTETIDPLLGVLRKEKEMQEGASDVKIEEKDKHLYIFEEKPFQIQSVCELLSTQLLHRSESSETARKNIVQNSPILRKCAKKKLLILDLNGLLADIVIHPPPGQKADRKINVFKRPFCDDFLRFCFEKYEMAVWSSRKRDNANIVVNALMGELKDRLLFCWDQSKCTKTGFYTVENKHKPLFLKELKKIWDKEDPDLPWERGYYLPSNTLLLDDSPYKSLRNPPFTAIFPQPYNFMDKQDNVLGPGGELRLYLEELAEVNDVQQYVQAHPYGQHHINESNPSWPFYLQILNNVAIAR